MDARQSTPVELSFAPRAPTLSCQRMAGISEAARTKHLDPKLLLQCAAEPVLHRRTFIARRRRSLIVRLGLDPEADKVRAGGAGDLRKPVVQFLGALDGDRI